MNKNRRKNSRANNAATGKRYSLDESIYNCITAMLDGFKANHVPLDVIAKAVENVCSSYHKSEQKAESVDKAKLDAACDKIDEVFHNYAKMELALAKSEGRSVDMINLTVVARRIVNAYMKGIDGLSLDKVGVAVVREDDGSISLNVSIPRDDESE